MRARTFIPFLLALAATASAHESLDAAWIQPLAPIAIRGPIVPLGFTHGLGPWADLTLEATPYWAQGGVCGNGCRDRVLGFIATAGVSIGRPIISGADAELDWFAGPKAIAAVSSETGIAGDAGSPFAFIPGTAYEFGAGVDVGLQVHGRRVGWFAALVVGLQYTKAYNYGLYDDATPNAPTWPVTIMRGPTFGFRRDDWYTLLVPNLNVLRVGFVF